MKTNSKHSNTFDGTGIAAALLTASGWAFAGIFIRLLPGISTYFIVAIRFTVALVVMMPLLWLIQKDRITSICSLRYAEYWYMSIILVGCSTLGTTAFQMAPVGEATLLMNTAPLFVIVYKLLNREKIQKNESLGVLFTVLGISFILVTEFSITETGVLQRLLGDGLALLVALLVAFYAFRFRLLSQRGEAPDEKTLTLLTLALGSIVLWVVTAFVPNAIKIQVLDEQVLVAFAGLGIISTAIPTLGYAIASRRLPPILTTAVLLMEPIFAVIFAYLILKEVPSPLFVPSGLLVLGGLVFISKSKQ
ncbi:MAG: DMT family transporter [Hassallia sp. WJT32-NPBG1]|jgi:drug/metabolite transporter (DMT)-like permease|nr:DMT family transporter [Hassallia sp. WJT32-NPBG1]